jgi:ABC-2 type transport system permease protein
MFDTTLNFSRMHALIKKEIIQMFRDTSSILTAFVYPMIFLVIYGAGVSLDINHLPIAVVLEDSSTLARSFSDALSYSTYMDVQVYNDRHIPIDLLSRGRVRGIVIVPAYFTENYFNPSQVAPIQIIADGSEPNTANFVTNYVQAAWINWERGKNKSLGRVDPSVIKIVPRVWYNEELKSQYFLLPGSIVVIMTITGTMLTALVISREWERGTMEALMTTPITILEILLSKLTAYFLLGACSVTLCFFVGYYIFGVPFRGSFLGMATSSVSYLIFALGMGLFISTIAKNQFAASQIAILSSFLPSFILSGFIFDIDNMPIALRALTHIIPARYFVENLKTLYLVGDVWPLLLPNIGFILLIAFFFIRRALKSSVKRLD